MPPIKKSAVALDFTSFPAPPAGAKDWKADPDSIAQPGLLKDERFNQDPYHAARLRAARKEHGYHVREDSLRVHSSQASSGSTPPVNYLANAQWLRQEMHTYRPECATPLAAPQVPSAVSKTPPSSVSKLNSVATISTPFANPMARNPTHQVSSKTETASMVEEQHPPAVMDLPAWAGPLEQALSELRPPTPCTSESPPKSLPPHLRKRQSNTNGTPEKVSSQKSRGLDDRLPSFDADFKAACEASRRVSDPTASQMEAYLEFQRREDKTVTAVNDALSNHPMLAIDQLLKAFDESATAPAEMVFYTNYGHHLKVSTFFTMIKDLLEPVILKLNNEELDRRILHLSSLSEHHWRKLHCSNAASKGSSNVHEVSGVPNCHRVNGHPNCHQVNNPSNGYHGVEGSKH